MHNEDQRERAHAGTDEPWKEPGQTAQAPEIKPSPDVLEEEKRKKGIKDGANPLAPESRPPAGKP